MEPLRVCILGAGALGCVIGGALTEAGHEVWLVNRSAALVEALRARGLVLREAGADRTVAVQAAAGCAAVAAAGGPVDLLVVLVKSFHTEAAIAGARALVGPQTAVLSLQNGLGHEDVLAAAVGRERVLAGKTYLGGTQLAPGHVLAGIAGKETVIGELDGTRSARAERIARVFSAARLATTVSDNIQGVIWDKLFVNVATGALSGITGLPYGELYQVPEIEACAVAAVAEAMAVARAAGIAIATTDPREPWRKASTGLPPAFKASMLQSLEKGSVTEIDYVNGSVVRWGRRTGVPTPVNCTLVACLKGRERLLVRPEPHP